MPQNIELSGALYEECAMVQRFYTSCFTALTAWVRAKEKASEEHPDDPKLKREAWAARKHASLQAVLIKSTVQAWGASKRIAERNVWAYALLDVIEQTKPFADRTAHLAFPSEAEEMVKAGKLPPATCPRWKENWTAEFSTDTNTIYLVAPSGEKKAVFRESAAIYTRDGEQYIRSIFRRCINSDETQE